MKCAPGRDLCRNSRDSLHVRGDGLFLPVFTSASQPSIAAHHPQKPSVQRRFRGVASGMVNEVGARIGTYFHALRMGLSVGSLYS